jgi:ribosomal protein S18 acetylase RimI-like enzyme
MTDSDRVRGTIRFIAPTVKDEWRHADVLIAELKEWDVRQSEALGFDGDEVMSVFYPGDIGDIRRDSVPPEGCLLLAIDASLPVGCAAYRRLTSSACELYDVYVRPTCRGMGIGSALLQRLMRDAKVAGYRAMCLETAAFMHDAHKLYRSLHFQVRAPYRSIPTKFAHATMWMECNLGELGLPEPRVAALAR